MAESKRIVFSFDERSFETLQDIQRRGKFSSMAQVVREALRILGALQLQKDEGFDQVVVKKQNGEARVLLL